MFDVSVVIPCHDGLTWLPETLESALNQTGVEVEVILVDDGSRDGTLEWAGSVQSRRVKTLRARPGVGGSCSRLSGAREAQGEYVALLDQDDLWAPEKLARQLQLFGEVPDLVAVGTLERRINTAGDPGPVVFRELLTDEQQALVRRVRAVPFVVSSMVMRRQTALEVLEVTEWSAVQDLAMFAELARRGPLGRVEEPLTSKRGHMEAESANLHVEIVVARRYLQLIYDDPQRIRDLSFDDFLASGSVSRRDLRQLRAQGLSVRAGYHRASGDRRAWAWGHARALLVDPLYRLK